MTLPTYITGNIQTKAYRILREHVYDVLAVYELNPTIWSMLGIVAEARNGIRQVEIADHLRVKPPMVTVMAQSLQARGYIQSVQNQFDARAKLLALTPDGRKFMRVVEKNLASELNFLLYGVSEVDLHAYHKVLTTIIANNERPRIKPSV